MCHVIMNKYVIIYKNDLHNLEVCKNYVYGPLGLIF